MFDNNDIKLQIMKLWKDTFHDTDEYIKLVFDNYFNPELVEYKVENGEVLAAMLGVPYYFDMKLAIKLFSVLLTKKPEN